MSQQIIAQPPLTSAAFAPPYGGDVLDATGGAPDKMINEGLCGRHHDRARLEFDGGGRAGVSIFDAQPRTLPYDFDLVERHPDGSQCFVPMTPPAPPFLVIAAPPDDGGTPPGIPCAFLTAPPGQAVNFHRGTWHGGVLTPPLSAPGLFAVVDRIGPPGANLEEYRYEEGFTVTQT